MKRKRKSKLNIRNEFFMQEPPGATVKSTLLLFVSWQARTGLGEWRSRQAWKSHIKKTRVPKALKRRSPTSISLGRIGIFGQGYLIKQDSKS